MAVNTAGSPPTRQQLDSAIGNVLRNLHIALKQAVQLKETVDSIGNTELQAAPYGYTADEAYLLALAFEKAAELEQVYGGGALPGAPYDYEELTLPLRGISY